MTRADLVDLVKLLQSGQGTEEEVSDRIDLLERSVPHPGVCDLIFQDMRNLTADQIVDEALAYRPIPLPSGDGDKR